MGKGSTPSRALLTLEVSVSLDDDPLQRQCMLRLLRLPGEEGDGVVRHESKVIHELVHILVAAFVHLALDHCHVNGLLHHRVVVRGDLEEQPGKGRLMALVLYTALILTQQL